MELGVVEWAEEGMGREDGRRVPGTYRRAKCRGRLAEIQLGWGDVGEGLG